VFRAISQEPAGSAIFKKFGIRATPTVMLLDPDGSEVDWLLGYGPPPEKFQEQLQKSLDGIETFQRLSAAFAKNPNDVAAVFKLGTKYANRYQLDKAAELYKKVLALDPNGKKGKTDFDGENVPLTQYAEFNLGGAALTARPQDPVPMLAFIKKYSTGKIIREAYDRLSSYYFLRAAPKEDAAKFYAEFTDRFPKDPLAFDAWMNRILTDGGPFDLGIELGRKAVGLMGGKPQPRVTLSLARIYSSSRDQAKAVETAELAVKQAKGTDDEQRVIPSAATIFISAGESEKALAVYGPAYAKSAWDNAGLLLRYASFWSAQKGNLGSALQAAMRATELQPDLVPAWSALSDVHFAEKNYAEALRAAEKAHEIAAPGRMKESIQKRIEAIKKQSLEK
jgi:tetratricopeptide (TPR) repeat protein